MKILDIGSVTDAAQIKIKAGTLKFLQDANQEAFAALLTGLIGPAYNPGTVYLIYGVKNTGSGLNYIISAGAAFYGGEIFLIDAASFTVSGGNTAVFTIGITQYTTNADPVTFTDSTVHNVHNIRKIVVAGGASGSGIADYASGYFLSFAIPQQVVITATGQAVKSGVYPSVNIDVPNATNLNPVLYAGSYNVGDVPSVGGGGGVYNITFAALATASYYVMGTVISNGTPSSDSTLMWSIHSRTTTGFILNMEESGSYAQNVAFEYIIFAK